MIYIYIYMILYLLIILIIIFFYKKKHFSLKKINEWINNNYNTFTSGYEPTYNPELWNSDNDIKQSHNCYSYALNTISDELVDICENGNCDYINPQPGHHCCMTNRVNYDETNCENLKNRILCDNPDIYESEFENVCENNFYKIGLSVDPVTGKNKHPSYHFYRQNKNGLWSHKDGGGEANLLDSDKDIIVNPQLSNRDFGKYNYSEWCGYFCVPDNKNLNMARNNYFKNKLHYPSDKNCTDGYV